MREEENNQSSQDSKVKRFFKKRWVFPAIYIASAALILTAVLWYQNSSTDNAIDSEKFGYDTNMPGKGFNDPAVEVNRSMENIVLPLAKENRDMAVILKKFYDDQASEKDQEAALVVYQNQYHPNTGIDLMVKDSENFDVVAALSGTVTKVQDDALLGNVIEIDHENGIVTQYQSVKDIEVKVGTVVEQGQKLATAGKSMINEDAGVHVHFEIRKDGMPVNPEKYLDKPLSALQEATDNNVDETRLNEEEAAENQDSTTEEDATKEDGTKQEESTEDSERSTEDKSDADKQKQTDDREKQESPSENKDAKQDKTLNDDTAE